MMNELRGVIIQWFRLGVFLGVPSATLKAIRNDRKKEEDCKVCMLIEWSNLDTPTWEKLVTALVYTDLPSIAVKIASKHRESHVKFPSCKYNYYSNIALYWFPGVPLPATLVEKLKGRVSDSEVSVLLLCF